MNSLSCVSLALFASLPISAASFVTSTVCSIAPSQGITLTSSGETFCALSAPVTDSSYLALTRAGASITGNSLRQEINSFRITEAASAGASPRGSASSLDMISVAIDFSGPARYGFLTTSIFTNIDRDCPGCGPSFTINVNGASPSIGIHPPPIKVWLGSTSVVTVALRNYVVGEQFLPTRSNASVDATFAFFESDGITPAAISVSEAPEPNSLFLLAGALPVLVSWMLVTRIRGRSLSGELN